MTKRLSDLGKQGRELVAVNDGAFVLKRAGGVIRESVKI
jgi:hypothetical protein